MIKEIQKEISLLGSVLSLLGWDEKTHMPKMGLEARAGQISYIQQLIHKKLTDQKLYSELKKSRKTITVRELIKEVEKIRRIPKEFVQKLTKTVILGGAAWEHARKKNEYKIFLPHLKEIVKLKRKQARYLNPELGPYDALLDEYEESMRCKRLDEVFSYLASEIKKILMLIPKRKQVIPNLDVKTQERLNLSIIRKMGLKEDRSSIDVSMHPFTTKVGWNDVRITVRYINPYESLLSTIHEAGHALYELGLPERYRDTVICQAASTGLHESQSRFWENNIAKSYDFWKGFKGYQKAAKMSASELYENINVVKPSFIRVDSDEVTYPLHIILRYEIERDLINGRLKVEDAKREWNRKFYNYFGLKVRNDNDGILQDVHWSLGALGYFPTYAIGSVYAAQIYEKIGLNGVRSHNFKSILGWLRTKVHNKGKTKSADRIIKDCTGSGLDPKKFISYLTNKFNLKL